MNKRDPIRPFTAEERKQIRALVHQCANYDRPEKLCLMADNSCIMMDCYMLHKEYTGYMCKYFANAVLPLNPTLEAALRYRGPVETMPCTICGKAFIPKTNRAQYCSEKCLKLAQRDQARERKRKQRENVVVNVTF